MNDKISSEEEVHSAVEDPSGLALRCTCGSWSMLYRNSLRLDPFEEHSRHAHPESYCHRCKGPNVVWVAPSPLWNEVMRGGSIEGAEIHDGVVCPTCFALLAEERGVATLWRLHAARVNVELETVTPSGRVWNEQTWMFDPAPTSTDEENHKP